MTVVRDGVHPPFRLLTSNCIRFKDVYYNGVHSLMQLEIENLTDQPMTVQLDSTLQTQLAFQLENENIKDLDIKTDLATNTAAWATSMAPQDQSQFNQVFNYVNHIDHLDLLPKQTLGFVVAFLPDQQRYQSKTVTVPLEINGLVFFRLDNYSLEVDFNATACQSILAANELDTGVVFEDSLVGETYIKAITIRNLSAINLHWRLNTLDLELLRNKPVSSNSSTTSTSSVSNNNTVDDWLQFVDASTFIILDHDRLPVIPPFSHYTFQVIFTPKEVGKFNYDLQIENCYDIENVIQTRIHATMRTLKHRDTLIVSSGNLLDFGDCVSGTWTTQQIVLNNISELPIEVHFISDGAELGFDVVTKSDNQQQNWSSSTLSNKEHNSLSKVYANSHVSPSSSSDRSLTRSESPTPSHKTYGSMEEYSSVVSYASTGDVDNNDMLTAFNELYYSGNSSSSVVTTSTIKQTVTEQCNTRIEFMVLKPGVERIIQVSYRPAKDESANIYAGRFIRQNFNILLEYRPSKSSKPKELKLIQCKARSCTSFISVTPQSIHFGDTDVGTQKSLPVKIINQSDIHADVELVFESKVLNCLQGEIIIQPRSTVEIKLDIYPRKVNPYYKRQITLANYLNRDNDQIIEVSSNNVDKQRVTFHSRFYRILTPTGANFLDFGPVALNSPAIRTCTIANIRDASLLLGISTSSQHEIVIYSKKKKSYSRKASASNTPLKESPPILPPNTSLTKDRTILAKNYRTRLTTVQYTSTAYLDLATVPHVQFSSFFKHKRHIAKYITAKPVVAKKHTLNTTTTTVSNDHPACMTQKRYKKKKQQACVGITGTTTQFKKVRKRIIDWPDIAGKSRVPLDDLIAILEHGSLSRTPLFARQSLEEQFVRYQLAWRTELARLIERGELVPTSLLQLNPMEEEEIIIVYTPRVSSQSLTSKNTASISFRLIDFDQFSLTTSEEEEEENDEETMHLKQRRKHLNNFIPVLRKVIVRAQVCKSSMELGQRNINFGVTDRGEKHHNTIVLHNKSETPLLYTIKKSPSIASGDIHFGAARHGVIRAFGKREIEFTFEPTLPGTFTEQLEVINIRDTEDRNTISLKAMVRRPESFTIKSSAPELNFYACVQNQAQETITVTNINKQPRTFEIRIENNNSHFQASFFVDSAESLSKEQEEEIENLERKLKVAERKNQPDKIKKYIKKLAKVKKDSEEAATTEDVKVVMKQEEDGILLSLDPNTSKSISVCFKAQQKTNNEGQILQGRILIHEHKNMDTCKVIPFSVNLCKDHEACL